MKNLLQSQSVAILPAIVVAAVAASFAVAQQDPAAPNDSEKSIALLADELASSDFKLREAATAALKKAGAAAAEPVTKAGLGDSLEAGFRAVAILETLYLSDNGAVIDAGEEGLKTLRENAKNPVAKQAARALDGNYFTVRQKRAADAIRELGGQVQFERQRAALVDGKAIYPPGGWVSAVAIGRNWKGGDEGLRHIARLDSLRTLYLLKGHPLGDASIAELEAEMPRMIVQPRGAAFLGVGTQLDSLGCLIGTVQPDSAAAKGKLLSGDVVVEIDGLPVRRPEDLIAIVGEHDPDDTISVVVLRGDPVYRYKLIQMLNEQGAFSPIIAVGLIQQMRRELHVTLGSWQLDN